MIETTFGNNLIALRKNKGLTRQAFADLMNVPVTTIAGYETAGREPKFKTLIKISKYFGVSIDDLLQKKIPSVLEMIDPKKQALVESVLALPPERLQLLAMLTQTAGEVGATPVEGGGTQYNLTFTVTPKNDSEQSKGENNL